MANIIHKIFNLKHYYPCSDFSEAWIVIDIISILNNFEIGKDDQRGYNGIPKPHFLNL